MAQFACLPQTNRGQWWGGSSCSLHALQQHGHSHHQHNRHNGLGGEHLGGVVQKEERKRVIEGWFALLWFLDTVQEFWAISNQSKLACLNTSIPFLNVCRAIHATATHLHTFCDLLQCFVTLTIP